MKLEIHFVGGSRVLLPVRELPRVAECIEARSAALRAGSVTGGEGYRFIQEKQLRVPVWRHDHAVSFFEFQGACDPAATPVTTHDLLLLIVQSAAAITHHGPSRLCLNELPEWVDAILEGHR